MRFWPSGFAPQFCHLLKGVMVPAKSQTQMARKSKETRGKVICTRLFLKTDSAPSPRTCPKEASGNSTEPASLGVKQSAADAGICRDRTAIQTAGAVSGGPCSDTWREQRCARVPSRPPPVAMAAPTPPRRASPSFPVSRSLESRVCHVQEGRVGPRRGRHQALAGSGPLAPATPPAAPHSGSGAAARRVSSRAGVPARLPGTRGAPRAPGGSSRLQGARPSLAPFVSAGHLLNLSWHLGGRNQRGRGSKDFRWAPASAAPGEVPEQKQFLCACPRDNTLPAQMNQSYN